MDAYVRIRKIGEGSFGKALLVRRKSDGKQCVVKEINISKMGRKEREDSRKEVNVLSQMKHPNIVAYQESFEDGGSLYIAMDYCDGGDLYKKISEQKGKLFTEDQVLNWFVQISLGLKHVHDRKILHRDIKSQNIFLTKSGVVKLGDFGIAKVLSSTVELARTCIGTPYYLSPEICENRPYNNKSDVWALGCVLYELATLKHAFEAGNMKNLVLKIIRGSYPPVSTRYSREMRSLIDSCLKLHPRQRPSVNGLLRLPIIQKRIGGLLSETIQADEFSHTVLHRHRKPAAPNPRPHPLGAAGKAIPPKLDPPPPGPVRKYQPAAVYGVGKGSRDKKNIIVRPRPRPLPSQQPAPARKPISAALAARRRVADERERAQKEELRKQHAIEAKLQHQNFARKQNAARLQQAKKAAAQGWRATLSGGIDKLPDGQNDKLANNQEPHSQEEAKKEKENFEQPPVQNVQETVQKERAVAVEAVEKARMITDFHQRRREAAANKARGQAQWGAPPVQLPPHTPAVSNISVAGEKGKNKAEDEYLKKLRAIRQQNYLEKKRIQQRMALYRPDPQRQQPSDGTRVVSQVQPTLEERRRKIAALKAQADVQEARRKKMEEERQKQKMAAVSKQPDQPPAKEEKVEPQAKWAEPRKHWGESPAAAPVIAQQCDATGVVIEDTTSVVFEEGAAEPVRKQWANEGGQPIVAMLHQKTIQTATYAVGKDELSGQTKIEVIEITNTVTQTNREASTEQKKDTKPPTSDQSSNLDDSPQIDELVDDKKTTESSQKPVESVAQDEKQPEEKSLVTVSNEPHNEEPHNEEPPVKQAWGDEQMKEDSARGKSVAPTKDSEDSSLQVLDIEEEVTSSITVSEVPPTVEDIFSTPTAPSPQLTKPLNKPEKPLVEKAHDSPKQQEQDRHSSILSLSLQAGLFDTNINVLHTCSLPDLRSLFATENVLEEYEGSEVGSSEEEDSSEEEGSFEEESFTGERENVSDASGEEDAQEDDEDDDLQQLVMTLQSFVEDAKSPVHSAPPRTKEAVLTSPPAFPISENWEDSDDEGEPVEDPQSSEGGSVFSRLEETRTLLERKLGLNTLMEAYQLVQTCYEDDSTPSEGSGSDKMVPHDHIVAVIGEQNAQHYHTLIHLVMADSAYSQNNEPPVIITEDAVGETHAVVV